MNEYAEIIKKSLYTNAVFKKELAENEVFSKEFAKAAEVILKCLKEGHKLLIAGNGGSMADALHFEAELVGRYKKNRKPVPALALAKGLSTVTAIGNDYDFNQIFCREVEAYGEEGDILFSISTSGKSVNLIEAINKARRLGLKTISLLGKDGGEIKRISGISLVVPATETNTIQEVHEHLIHTLSGLIEEAI
jgi:D-sedoheptulose 7-phosphate isomerase